MPQENISEKEFETKLLPLIKKLKSGEIDPHEFAEQAGALIKLIPKQLRYFKDEELGWAKYWIEEINYYGVEKVLSGRFDFFKFLEKRLGGK